MATSPSKMTKTIASFYAAVMLAENPGSVNDPDLGPDDRREWTRLWPGWKLEQLALERTLAAGESRTSDQQRARLEDLIRRYDRLTHAGPRALSPLNADEALFAEEVWSSPDPQRSEETPTEPGETTSRLKPVGRSTGR